MLNPRHLLGFAFAAVVVVGLMPGFSGGPFSGLSGAPGDSDCTICHGDFPLNSGAGVIADFRINGDDTTLGGPVAINVGFDNTTRARHGFQVTVRDNSGLFGTAAFSGSLSILDPINTQYADFGGNTQYITHNSAGSFLDQWLVSWSPDASTPAGPITVYAAGNAGNSDGNLTGDYIFTTQKTIYQAEVSGNATWTSGTAQTININAPGQIFQGYALVLSEDPTDTPVSATLSMAVNPFSIFGDLSLSGFPLFQNFIGLTDATGSATATALVPPFPSSLAGVELHLGAVFFDSLQLPAFVPQEVSNQFTITLQ